MNRRSLMKRSSDGHEVMDAELKSKPNAVSSVAQKARVIQKKSGALNKSTVSIGKQDNHALQKQIKVHAQLAEVAKTPAQRMTSDAAAFRLKHAAGQGATRDQVTARSAFVGVHGDSQSFGMSAATQTRLGLQAWRHQ